MPDDIPGVGHNQPPDSDFDDLKARANDFGQSAVEWGQAGVDDDQNAALLKEFVSGARALIKEIEEMRTARKQPYLDAGRAIDAQFKPLRDAVEKAGKTAKDLLTSYLTKKERELVEQRRREAEEAAKREAEAQAAAAEAERQGDMVAAAEAQERAEREAQAAEKAAAPEATRARVTGGAGNAMSMRAFRVAQIDVLPLALAHYKHHPEIAAAIVRIANVEIRASKGADIEIPGIKIVTKRRVA